MLDLDLLQSLTAAPGLPGREGRVAGLIRAGLPTSCQVESDVLGNLVARIEGQGPKVMLVAHMDEVGLIVRRIAPDGCLYVERLGGSSVRALPGARLDLWTGEGRLPAHAGLLPGHLDDHRSLELKDIYIDIGARSAEHAGELGVRPGDGLTWSAPLQRYGEHLVSGKALDDRLGCLVLISLANSLLPAELNCDLHLAFVVQEETTLMGGAPVARRVRPDLVIGVDGTLAFDTPDLEGAQSDVRLGGGPAIKLMDAIRGKTASYVPDWDTAEKLRKLGDERGIPLQVEITSGLSTALTPLPFVSQGIRTAALSIPVRYHHTPVETADLRDAEQLVTLLEHLLTA